MVGKETSSDTEALGLHAYHIFVVFAIAIAVHCEHMALAEKTSVFARSYAIIFWTTAFGASEFHALVFILHYVRLLTLMFVEFCFRVGLSVQFPFPIRGIWCTMSTRSLSKAILCQTQHFMLMEISPVFGSMNILMNQTQFAASKYISSW